MTHLYLRKKLNTWLDFHQQALFRLPFYHELYNSELAEVKSSGKENYEQFVNNFEGSRGYAPAHIEYFR